MLFKNGLIFFFIFISACGPDSEISFFQFPSQSQEQQQQEEEDTGPETLIISGFFAADNNAHDGKVFCIAQGEELSTCTAEIDDSDGSFACDGIHVDSPVTCFLRNSETDQILSTFEFNDQELPHEATPFSSSTTLSIPLSESVELKGFGDDQKLVYDLNRKVIPIKLTSLSSSISNDITQISLDTFNNQEWQMTCITTGDQQFDDDCIDNFDCEECNGVTDLFYTRLIPLEKNGVNFNALSIWTRFANFTGCNSKDLQSNNEEDLNTEDYFVDPSISIGLWGSGSACPDNDWLDFFPRAREPGILNNFYNLSIQKNDGELNPNSFYTKKSWKYNSDQCENIHESFVNLYPTSNENEFYAFYSYKKYEFGNCAGTQTVNKSHWVKINHYEATE